MQRNKLNLLMILTVVGIGLAGGVLMSKAETPTRANETQVVHRVVIDAASSDPKVWVSLVSNTENLIKAFGIGTVEIEIVSHGEGLKLLMKSSADRPIDRMQKLVEYGVVFAACENTMKSMKLTVDDLVDFATPVNSAVAELVLKQEKGWSYLKK